MAPNMHSQPLGRRAQEPGSSSVVRHPPPYFAGQILAFGAAFTSTWSGVKLLGVNATDYFLVAAVFFVLVAGAVKRRRLPIYAWAVLPPATLLLVALVGSIVRGDPLASKRATNQWVVGTALAAEQSGALPLVARMSLSLTAVVIIVAGFCVILGGGERFVRRAIYAWAMGAATSGLYALLESFGLINLPFLYRIMSETRVAGLASHPNSLGQTLTLVLPVLIYMLGKTRGMTRITAAVAVPISASAILLTGSRAALLCGTVVVISVAAYYVYATKRIPIWFLVGGPAILVALLVAVPLTLEASRFVDESGVASNLARTASLERAVNDFLSSPLFGLGIGGPAPTMVPLTILVYGGLFYFAVFYGALMYPLFARPRTLPGLFVPTLVIASVSVLGYGLLNNAFVDRYLYWPFAAVFALGLWRASFEPLSSAHLGAAAIRDSRRAHSATIDNLKRVIPRGKAASSAQILAHG